MKKSLLRVLLGLLLTTTGPGRSLAGSPAAPPPLSADTLRARLQRPGLPDTLRVQYLGQLCGALHTTDLPAARRYGEQGAALARRLGYHRGAAKVLSNLAAVCYYASDYRAAQRYFEQCLTVSQRAHLSEQTGHAYLGLGNVAQALKDIPRALRHFEQARQAYAACRPPYVNGQILVLNNSANAYAMRHDTLRGSQRLRQALALTSPATEPRLTITVLGGLAECLMQLGRPDSAQLLLQRGLQLADSTHNLAGQSEMNTRLASVALARRQPGPARAYAALAGQQARQLGRPFLEMQALESLADALHALHRPEAFDTLKRYTTVRDTVQAHDYADEMAEAQTRFDLAGAEARAQLSSQRLQLATQRRELDRLRYRQQVAGVGALALLALAGAGGLLWRYRRRQAAREEALRTRLAADLHDDVGGLLSQISMQSGLLQEGLADPASQRRQLGQISEASRTAVRQLNDVVWSLDAHNDHLPNLLDRMRDYAHELLPPAGIAVQFAAGPGLPAQRLPVLLRRNLYLIYKEALHNVLKHAHGATAVTIGLRQEGPLLVLTIEDDGRVAEVAGAAPAGRRTGHGLRNMRARAASIGGEVASGPRPAGVGYAVRVALPLAMA